MRVVVAFEALWPRWRRSGILFEAQEPGTTVNPPTYHRIGQWKRKNSAATGAKGKGVSNFIDGTVGLSSLGVLGFSDGGFDLYWVWECTGLASELGLWEVAEGAVDRADRGRGDAASD